MQDLDKIMDRVRKLIALGSNNPNEHEANAAMARAHKLLAAHNLSMEALTEAERDDADPYVTQEHYQPNFQGCAAARHIAAAVGKLYFCHMYYTTSKNGDVYHFVGRSSNAAVAQAVTATVVKYLRKECAAQGKGIPGFNTSFMNAAMVRIRERCKAMVREAEEGLMQGEDGKNLPAMVSVYADAQAGAKQFLQSQGVRLQTAKSRMTGGQGYGAGMGAAAGRQAGERANLRNSIHNK